MLSAMRARPGDTPARYEELELDRYSTNEKEGER